MAKRYTTKQIVTAYEKKGCNVSATCATLGISRRTFYNWRQSKPSLDNLLKDAEESVIDFTESKLIERINEGDITAIIFYLKTKGKKRGYVEQLDQNVKLNPFEEVMKSLPDNPE